MKSRLRRRRKKTNVPKPSKLILKNGNASSSASTTSILSHNYYCQMLSMKLDKQNKPTRNLLMLPTLASLPRTMLW